MITITGDRAEILFSWPTNDTGHNQAVLKMMAQQAGQLVRQQGRQQKGGIKFEDIRRTETGFEFVFSAKLEPLPEEVPGA